MLRKSSAMSIKALQHTMNQFGHIWSCFGHVAHGPPFPTTKGQPSQRRLTAAAPPTYPEVSTAPSNNRDPLSDTFHMVLLDRKCWLFEDSSLLSSHVSHVDFREQHKSFSSRMVSALITCRKRRLKLQVSNTHFAAIKIETTTTCPGDTEAVCESNKLVQAMACNKKRGFSGRNRKPT